jgi:hypothetical protein
MFVYLGMGVLCAMYFGSHVRTQAFFLAVFLNFY